MKIDDLALKSVSIVDRYDQAELAGLSDLRKSITRIAGDPSLETSLPPLEGSDLERRHELLLKVEFTTAIDLERIDYSDNVAPEFFLCDRPNANLALRSSDIYHNGAEVFGRTSSDSKHANTGGPDQRHDYYTYMRVAFRELRPSNPPFESFDLSKTPEDVCFRLIGGRYRTLGYRSNVITLSAKLISQSLQDSGFVPPP